MKYRKILAVMTAILLCLSLCGCETFDNFRAAFFEDKAEDVPVIKIGVFEPLTGSYAEAAADEVAGIELAHSLWPTALGAEIQLVYADNQSDYTRAEACARELAEQQVSLVIGSYSSVLSLAGSDVLKEACIPAIAVTCTNPILTQTNEYYFRVCCTDALEGEGAAKFVVDGLRIPAAAILTAQGDDYGVARGEAFEKAFANYLKSYIPPEEDPDYVPLIPDEDDTSENVADTPEGETQDGTSEAQDTPDSAEEKDAEASADPESPDDATAGNDGDSSSQGRSSSLTDAVRSIPDYGTTTYSYDPQTPDWTSLLATIYRAGYDVIYFPSELETAQELISISDELGYSFTWVGTSQWKGITSEGAIYTSEYDNTAALSSVSETFLKAYSEKYPDQEPSENVALGFDAYLLALEAINKAGTYEDSLSLKNALLTTEELPTATGSITVNSYGDPIKPVIIERITDGSPVMLYATMELDTEEETDADPDSGDQDTDDQEDQGDDSGDWKDQDEDSDIWAD